MNLLFRLLVLFLVVSSSVYAEGATPAPSNPIKADAGTIVRTLQDHLSNTYDVRNYGVKCDGQELTDISTTTGSPVISSTGYVFKTKDIGKTAIVWGSGAGSIIVSGTILSVNGSEATLSANSAFTRVGTRLIFYKTDNTNNLNSAISAVSAMGGGRLRLPPGVCAASQVVLKRQVILEGESRNSTVLFQISGSNTDFVISENFNSLTNTGLNYGDNDLHNGIQSSTLVPSWFGLTSLRVDGNRYNQTVPGNCVSFYGNAQIWDSVLVMNCSKNGMWTEASGGYAYSPVDWKGTEEGFFNDVIVRNVQDDGWRMRGPHDSIVTSYLAYAWGGSGTGYGFRSESNGTVYNGAGHFWHIHPYTSDGQKTSIYLGAGNSDIQFMYSDFGTTVIPSDNNKINTMFSLGCGISGQSPCVTVSGGNNTVSQLNLQFTGLGAGLPTNLIGVSVPAQFITSGLNTIHITGSSVPSSTADNILVQVRSNFNKIEGVLSNMNGTNNVCADLGGSYNYFNFRTVACKTHTRYNSGGFQNEVHSRSYVLGGETGLQGTINVADTWVYTGNAVRFNSSPAGSVTNPGHIFGGYTGNGFYAASNSISLAIAGANNSTWNSSGLTVSSGSVVVGVAGTTKGTLGLAGNTSGLVTISPQAAAGTYNFNLPTTAGTAGQPMLSGGGGSNPMTWGSRSGNTTTFATVSGTLTSNDCVKFDANGNAVASGVSCAGVSSGNTATQFDYGAACDGTTNDTTALQAWVSSGKTLIGKAGIGKCIVQGPLTFSTANQKYIGQGAKLSWTANIANAKAIEVTASGVSIDGIWMDNPNELKSQTGNHYGAIYVNASNFSLQNSYIEKFLDGVVQAPSDTNKGFTVHNTVIKDVLGGGNGSGSDPQTCGTGLNEGCGEDRGDGVVCWGQDCKVTDNTISCKTGADCRIGVHGENLSYPSPRHYNFTFTGNIITGPFRRALACEATDNCNMSDNTGKGQTWWNVSCINTTNCGGTGNKFYYDLPAGDTTGSSWSPRKGPLYVYGKAQNTSFDSSNQFIISGEQAEFGGILLGLNSGDLRGANNFIGAQFIGNDYVSRCVSLEYQDAPVISASCRGFKNYGIFSFDVSKQNYSNNYVDFVNKYQTKVITGTITGSYTLGEIISGATSKATGKLVYIDPTNKLLTIANVELTGNTTSGNTTVSGLSSMSGLVVGSVISGPGIPDGATVSSVGASSVVLNVAATATRTGARLQIEADRFQVGETVTGVSSTASATVSLTKKYGTCVLDQDNSTTNLAGMYDSNQCYNAAKGIEIPSKTKGSVQNWKFHNVTTAIDLFGSTDMIAKNNVNSFVTTACANCGGSGNDLGAGGGGGTPGGTNGQIQYNNAGAFGGVTAVPIPNGGTGATTATAAINALVPSQSGQNFKVLQTDGTSVSWQASGCTTSIITFDGGTTGLTFSAPITVCGASPGPSSSPVTKTASYTLLLTDSSSYFRMNCSSSCNLTVPPNSSAAFPVGQEIGLEQAGAGVVNVVAGAGVTINTYSTTTTGGQYATAALKKVATDTWILTGNLQ